tara:strand:+ start:373 stop:2094 length:1722 start_codon:yes stop_codon:yes gene_type:complete
MLVPKYTAQANRVTGVAGQQMSFKVPGGALSQAAVAQGQAFNKVSQEAAQWGAVAYKMHRDTVVAGAVAKATASVDKALNESQTRDIADPKYAKKGGGILGFFNDAVTSITKTAGSTSFDPLTNNRISAAVAGYVAGQRRTLDRYNAGRLVDIAAANLSADREESIKRAANGLSSNWDGDVLTLPIAVIEEIDNAEKAQLDAARIGVTTALKAGEANLTLRSEIAKYAVNAHNNSARTSNQTQTLIEQLDDPSNFIWLDPFDRQELKTRLEAKFFRLQTSENSAAAAKLTADERKLKQNQQINEMDLWQRIAEANDTDDPSAMPTRADLDNAVASQPNNRGLTTAAYSALSKIISQEGADASNPQFVNDVYADINAIASDSSLGKIERDNRIRAVVERSSAEIGRGVSSKITQSDHLNLNRYADAAIKEQTFSEDHNRFLAFVKNGSAPIDRESKRLINESDIFKQIEAVYTYNQLRAQGMPPMRAAIEALRRVGVTATEDGDGIKAPPPFFPLALPAEVGLPAKTGEWEPKDIKAARDWTFKNRAQLLGRKKYFSLMNDIAAIEKYHTGQSQ